MWHSCPTAHPATLSATTTAASCTSAAWSTPSTVHDRQPCGVQLAESEVGGWFSREAQQSGDNNEAKQKRGKNILETAARLFTHRSHDCHSRNDHRSARSDCHLRHRDSCHPVGGAGSHRAAESTRGYGQYFNRSQ